MSALARALLSELADTLERDHDLASRFRKVLGSSADATGDTLLSLRDTGLSVRSLRQAITSGELPAQKVGREYRVRRSDLDAWIAVKRVKPRESTTLALISPADRAIERARRVGAIRAA